MTLKFRKFSSEDEKIYDSFMLRNPLNTFKYPRHWVVDDQCAVYFIGFGGQGDRSPEDSEPPDFYALMMSGKCIEFEGYRRILPVVDRAASISSYKNVHNITRIKVPGDMKNEVDNVFDVIREALLVYGNGMTKYPTEFI